MRHLIICPEYPPAPIPSGGIGTYAKNIAHLLAEAGETVHVIAILWPGAPTSVEKLHQGRLTIHRVPVDQVLDVEWNRGRESIAKDEINWLSWSSFPSQCFSMQAALYAEKLIADVGIDVIESQEYDAPLYYFQLRRSLGLGPRSKPPCIVHLHSPTELIFRGNDWSLAREDAQYASQMEAFSIRFADFRLCPSNYLARHAEHVYGLERNSTTVIPLPIGDTPALERNIDTWNDGTICYVGRLEPRKGVIEWVDAAVSVADDYPTTQFAFVGADLPYGPGQTVRQQLESQIPEHLTSRFTFHGDVNRPELMRLFAGARMAIVPSRWENFPNTCVEAMCTGLPVLVSKNGGMTEMIEDGRSGWIAPSQDPAGLESALRRALETPSLDLATMGRRAATYIRDFCRNETIVTRHLEFRKDVCRRANSGESSRQSASPAPATMRSPQATVDSRQQRTMAIVAVVDAPHLLQECLERVYDQGVAAKNVIVVVDENWAKRNSAMLKNVAEDGCHVLDHRSRARSALWNAGTSIALANADLPGKILYLDERDRLLPECVEKLEDVLDSRADVGLVSCWTRDSGKMIPRLSPSFPHQLVTNSIDTPLMIRAKLFNSVDGFDAAFDVGFELWAFTNESMAKDWTAIVYPQLLCERIAARHSTNQPAHRRMYLDILKKTEEVVSTHSLSIIELLKSQELDPVGSTPQNKSNSSLPKILRPLDVLHLSMADKFAVARAALRQPRRAMRFILWHVDTAIARIAKRTG